MNKQNKVPAFFQDVGEKIRTDAHVVYTVGWVLGVCGAIVSIVVALWQSNAAIAVIGVIGCLLLGACLAIVSRLMYGFGEMVDAATLPLEEAEGVDLVRGGIIDQEQNAFTPTVIPFEEDEEWLCPHCGGDVRYVAQIGAYQCAKCNRTYRAVGDGWEKQLKECE